MIHLNKLLYTLFILALAGVLISAKFINPVPRVAHVYLEKQNVFYAHVDNPLMVAIPGVPVNTILVSSSDCEIRATNKPGGFIVRANSGNRVTLQISYVDKGDTLSAGLFDYRIKRIPDPVAYVNAIRHEGILLKYELQNVLGVFTRMENFDFDCSFKPQSFTMSVYHDSTWTDYKTTGPTCNAEMKTALHNAMPEDKIIFHEIVTMGPDSIARKVNPVFITVK